MSKPDLLLKINPAANLLQLQDETEKNLLENIPVCRISFDWIARNAPVLMLEIEPHFWYQEMSLTPEQITLVRKFNIYDTPSWYVLDTPKPLTETWDEYGLSAGYEVQFVNGSHHLLGSGELETDLWDSQVVKFRQLIEWDVSLENATKPPTTDDLCSGCNHKRVHHRPRVMCGRLLNESGPPEYCSCMMFREA